MGDLHVVIGLVFDFAAYVAESNFGATSGNGDGREEREEEDEWGKELHG